MKPFKKIAPILCRNFEDFVRFLETWIDNLLLYVVYKCCCMTFEILCGTSLFNQTVEEFCVRRSKPTVTICPLIEKFLYLLSFHSFMIYTVDSTSNNLHAQFEKKRADYYICTLMHHARVTQSNWARDRVIQTFARSALPTLV